MLLIVESPSKCAKIESFIKCKCISSKGHIRELKKLPASPSDEPIYENIPDKKAHIESMKKVIKCYNPNDIYIATDDDREGEAIAWHICQVFGLPVETTKRIIFHEVTKTALEKAVKNPTIINMNIVKAQKARQVLDLMVGFKVSPILWKYLYRSKDNSLSAGRCQTPALRLVYDNEQEKAKAIIRQTHKITATFFPKKIEFVLSKEFETNEEVLKFMELSKGFRHVFSLGVKKDNIIMPPKPFNTSGLLQAASSSLRMTPKDTMSACQKLYQDGHITYMRTESQSYSVEFLQDVRKYILNTRTTEYLGDLQRLENRDEGNPHEAIRVTHLDVRTIEDSNSKIKRLYEFIWKNSVASCMSAARFEITPAYMTSPQIHETEIKYIHLIEVPVFLGWKILGSPPQNIDSLAFYMSSCQKEQLAISVKSQISVHGRHSHYTEASLIKKLEDIGIGRPSTYASLVETVIDRGYVKKMDIEGDLYEFMEYVLEGSEIKSQKIKKPIGAEKGKLVIQPTGILVAEFLTEHFRALFDYGYTEKMEKDLDKMMVGDCQKDICIECHKQIEELIKPVEKQMFVLKDTDEYVVVFGRYGAVLKNKTSKEFKSIQIKINMDRLRTGDYTLAELENKGEDILGVYDGGDVILMNGPFGKYIKYKEENIGLNLIETFCKSGVEQRMEQPIEQPMNEFLDEDISISLYDKFVKWYTRPKEEVNTKIIRELREGLSIRNGKYGAYIHHQTKDMKKPNFYKLKGFKESYRLCQKEILLEWIKKTYNLGEN
jgi:DNA topoisomerase-1